MKTSGRKEITEAVTIAVFGAIVCGAVTWAYEEAKHRVAERRKARAKSDKKESEK